MQYRFDRKQFGKSLISIPSLSSILAMMAVQIMTRSPHYFLLREDAVGRAVDSSGHAKAEAQRVAWPGDNGLCKFRPATLCAGV